MKLRLLQTVFVAAALFLGALIIRQGHPHLITATQAQGSAPGALEVATGAQNRAAVASIRSQLEACRKNDYAKALKYRSRLLSGQIPTAAAFQRMMETRYPAFLHYRSVSFGKAQTWDKGRHLLVPVTLKQADGTAVDSVYQMALEGGIYKVFGVAGGMSAPPPAPAVPSQLT